MTRQAQPMKLLCIDDDPDDFMFFEEAVKGPQWACECIHAKDGLKALAILETLLPDLIFLDNNMPSMNGLETCAVSVKTKRSTVFLSTCSQLTLHTVIVKPFKTWCQWMPDQAWIV
jgi:CheY-like chemotaxis protein